MTRRLFLAVWLITAMLVSGAAQAATRTRAQALSLVKEKYASRDVDIYYLEDDPASPGLWRFFVDANPMAGWEHECYLVTLPKTVPVSGTGFTETLRSVPPREVRTPADVKNRFENISWDKPNLPNAFTGNDPISEAGKRTYAVILNGGMDITSNEEQYWFNCAYMYQILTRTIGVPRNHMYVLMTNGTSTEPDINWGAPYGVTHSPIDLDGDNVIDVKYAATCDNVKAVLADIASKMTSGDHLLLFITGHGGIRESDNKCYTYLWTPDTPAVTTRATAFGYEVMYEDELAEWLAPVKSKDAAISVVITHCHAAGFFDSLHTLGCTVTAAAAENESSHCSPHGPFDEFAWHWMDAINGAELDGTKVDADTNRDGFVSMQEAYEYAKSMDAWTKPGAKKHETPEFKSVHNKLGCFLGLTHPLYPVDLYIATTPVDWGIYSPSNDSAFWSSPALWLRNAKDGGTVCDIPYYSSSHKQAYVYTTVTNRGWRTYRTGDYLHLYWHEGSTCVTPNGWRGREKDKGVATGGKIGSAAIEAFLLPCCSTTIAVPWNLPANVFSASSGQSVSLLANIRATDDDNIADDQLFYTFSAAKNPKTAQRTTTSLSAPTGAVSVRRDLRFTNLMSSEVRFDLDLRPLTEADKALFNDYYIEILVKPELYDRWKQGGVKLSGTYVTMASDGDRCIMLLGSNSSIHNIPAAGGSFEKIGVRLRNYSNNTVTGGPYHVDLVQSRTGGSVYGGVDLVAMSTTSRAATVSLKETNAEGAVLSVDLPESERVLGWYDSESQLVGCGDEATVRPLKDNSRFTVITASDGENAAYSCMDVDVPGTIKDLIRKDAGRFEVVLSDKAPRTLHIKVLSGLTAQTVCLSEIREGAESGTVDLSDVPGGTYILVVMDGEVMTDTWKFNK